MLKKGNQEVIHLCQVIPSNELSKFEKVKEKPKQQVSRCDTDRWWEEQVVVVVGGSGSGGALRRRRVAASMQLTHCLFQLRRSANAVRRRLTGFRLFVV